MVVGSILFVILCTITLSYSALQQSANVTSLIIANGYPVEVHTVQTTDGYDLILHRIPHGRSSKPIKGVVLLQHGLTDSSAGYCLNAPSEGLPYILADDGWDVWLGNNRGNGYSMNNIHYGPTDPEFWDFSWDDMALIDFPTNIDYVLSATGVKKIAYIGHSEGTIQAFAGLVSNPSIADKLHVYIALAPVAYVGGISVELIRILAKFDADELLILLGVREFYLPNLAHTLLPDLCDLRPSLCGYGSAIFYGEDSYLNDTRLDLYTIYEPFPTSAKNIIQWAQGVQSNKFQKFDYGIAGNLKHYGQTTPPQYDLSKFPTTLPTILVSGGIDGLADPTDVSLLVKQLPSNANVTVIHRDDYGHLDPLLGYDAYQLTYPFLLQIINSDNNN